MFKKHTIQNSNNNNRNGPRYESSQQKVPYDSLQQICSMGFPHNNLMTYSLMQRLPQMNNSKYPDQKEKLFFFVSVVPGVGKQNQRTYDFKQKITQKFATREIAGLSEVIYQCTIGNDQNVLPYVKYTRSNASKSLSIWMSTKNVKIGQNNLISRNTNITILSGQSYTISLSPDLALGMANILKEMVKKAIDLEFEVQSHQPNINKSSLTPNQGIIGSGY
jgi:hypothetical protein